MFLSGHFYQIRDTTSYPGRHGRMGDKLQKKDGRRKLTILNLFSTFLETECQAKMNPIPDY